MKEHKKIIVVGGVAGGASVAARARRLDEDAEIIMFEKGPDVSFSNCSLPYYLGNVIKDVNKVLVMSAEDLRNQDAINVQPNSEVVDIDPDEQIVTVKRVLTGKLEKFDYDYLFLSPGANPILPKNIKGIDRDNVFTLRNVVDVKKIHNYLTTNKISDVAVIGGGFIGLEVAENLRNRGYNISLIEAADHILGTLDEEMAQIVQKQLYDHKVNLVLNDGLSEIKDDKIILGSGKSVKAQAVIMAIGVSPDVKLAEKIGIKLGITGAIKVDEHYETNVKNIYAVGDAIEVTNALTHKPTRLALAWPAQMEARRAADHIYGRQINASGVYGCSSIHVFDTNVASVGLTEEKCNQEGIPYDTITVVVPYKVGIMPDNADITIKIIFSKPEGILLGGQAIGNAGVDRYIDVLVTMMKYHGTVYDLANQELCYSPWFSTAKNGLNMAGLAATNLLNGEYKHVSVKDVRKLSEQDAFIIDCRERFEYEEHGHLKKSVNIPLSEFRDRLDEIPHDKPVYIHCLSGQRSYFMVRALENLGYDQVYNIDGSYLGICQYEYFRDQTENRSPIVTKYRFELLH